MATATSIPPLETCAGSPNQILGYITGGLPRRVLFLPALHSLGISKVTRLPLAMQGMIIPIENSLLARRLINSYAL